MSSVVFSIFGRKDKADSRRGKDTATARASDTTVANSAVPSGAAQREIARKTAEKIDRIESEMIASGLPVPPPPKRVQEMAPLAFESSGGAGRAPLPANAAAPDNQPGRTASNSIAIGDTAHAGDIQVSGSSMPPELEEAAILFANGQAKPAEATLKQAISSGSLGASSQQAWVMLFDIYQSTGQKDPFDSMSLDYAARFELSPPAWRDHAPGAGAPAKGLASGANVLFAATIDSNLTKQFEQMKKAAANFKPAVLEFVSVKRIENTAADLLMQAIEVFKAGKHELVLANAHKLFEAACANIETGRRDDHQASWMLALEMLRVQGLKQKFDDMSIDYCVTYEVSPPSWEPMPAWIRGDILSTSTKKSDEGDAEVANPAETDAFLMAGEIVGRMQSELAALREYAQGRHDLAIDCRELTRLDFVAAGELLNEVVTLRNAGKTIVFVEPNFLVLALMKVMGIHELADIRRRK